MPNKIARRVVALLVLAGAAVAAGGEMGPAAGDPFAGVERLELESLVAAVLARNPSLEAARHAARAAEARVEQATAWPDPMVSAGLAPLSIASDDMPFGGRVEARQRLPYSARLRRAGDAAAVLALAADAGAEETALALAHAAADLYHQLYLLERSREINALNVDLLRQLQTTAATRYAAGLEPQQAPLAAEVELTHVLHRDMDLAAERHVLVARLNGLLHRPPGSPVPPVAPPAERPVPDELLPPPHDPGAPHAHAAPPAAAAPGPAPLPPRPELAAAGAEVAARRLEVELAGLARRPDLELMTSYDSMFPGDHRWMVGVAVELPVQRERIAAREAEAQAELAAAESRREALASAVRAEVAAAAVHLGHTVHVLQLYRDRLGPASRDQVLAARSGFETGQVDLGTVIAAERNLRDVELATVEARVELARAWTALDRASGRLPGGELPAAPGEPVGREPLPSSTTDPDLDSVHPPEATAVGAAGAPR